MLPSQRPTGRFFSSAFQVMDKTKPQRVLGLRCMACTGLVAFLASHLVLPDHILIRPQ